MYVIFPAEEVVQLTLGGIVPHQHLQHHLSHQQYEQHLQQEGTDTFTLLHRELTESQQNLQHSHPSKRGELFLTADPVGSKSFTFPITIFSSFCSLVQFFCKCNSRELIFHRDISLRI